MFEVANKIYRGLPLFKYDSTQVYGYDFDELQESVSDKIKADDYDFDELLEKIPFLGIKTKND